jgi:hypothetical protein
VNYGGGYMGIGFAGGLWNGGVFAYNTAVVRVNASVVTNVYINRTIVQQTTIINTTNVSYNGGPNGVQHQPIAEDPVAEREQHTAPTTFQQQHMTQAAADKGNLASSNGGHPTTLALAKPLAGETHAPPAGFKPQPSKPLTELAKAQASPTTVAAAKTATAKTATVAKSAPPPAAKPASVPLAKAATEAAPKSGSAPARPAAKAASKPATKPPAKPEAAVAAKPAAKPPAKRETETTAKPEAKPAAKLGEKSKPKRDEKE